MDLREIRELVAEIEEDIRKQQVQTHLSSFTTANFSKKVFKIDKVSPSTTNSEFMKKK